MSEWLIILSVSGCLALIAIAGLGLAALLSCLESFVKTFE